MLHFMYPFVVCPDLGFLMHPVHFVYLIQCVHLKMRHIAWNNLSRKSECVSRPIRRIFERGVTKLVMNTYFTLIMVKNHIITN